MRRLQLLFVGLCLACGAPQIPNLDSPGTTIVCFGDSITAGVGAGNEPSYPLVLSQLLGVEVLNAGVPGDTSLDGLARLDKVLALDPWLVVVELGGNDLLHQLPVERTEAALGQILQRLLTAGVVPVLVEVHGPFGGRYKRLFERLEERYGVPVVRKVLGRILADPRLKSDRIHPNGAGYRRLAEAVAEVLQPILAAREAL